MRYLHPDVLDNGPALISSSATSAMLLPFYATGMSYGQAVSIALINASISSVDFSFSDEGTGRKVTFGGKVAAASLGISLSNDLHVAYTDGARILWVEPIKPSLVIAGQNYQLPVQVLISNQPNQI